MTFDLGKTVVTRGVNDTIADDKQFAIFVVNSLKRHVNGDWGDLCDEDKKTNNYAVRNGERILSKYNFNGDVSIYIITEWDRSYTTILFPEEY